MSPRPNVMSPEFRANPYTFFSQMLEHTPVCQVDPLGMWLITRYDDCLTILKDAQRFSSGTYGATLPDFLSDVFITNAIANSLVSRDPPYHTKLRNLVRGAFGGPSMGKLEERIRVLSEELATRIANKGEVEFISEFALPLPAFVIGGLLGLDPSMHARFKQWSDDLVAAMTGAYTPEDAIRIKRSFQDAELILREVVEERRRQPQEDMVSELLRAEVDGKALDEQELLGFLGLLIVTGLETTEHLMGNTMVSLSERPEIFERVRAEPALMPQLLEESLRFEPPVQGVFRLATTEVELSGVTIPKGSMLYVSLAAACRDPRQFPDPHRFDIDRTKLGNLPFGHGVHFCLGSALSRMEARLALGALFSKVKSFRRVNSQSVDWNHALHVRGPARLPLVFTRA